MAFTSFRFWSTTVAVFVLCWILSSAYRIDPCSKYTPYRIVALCIWRDRSKRALTQAIEQPQSIFPKKASGIVQDESTIMTHQKRRTNEINYMTNAFVPVVKRRWSAVRMLADSCCRSNCDIFKICP
ncbi:uncharacterized protein LOC106869569 [Octopus bimaculoides]|uniref:Insulin-like domain-containing protein n=1 Tax=Octopus bimaculoides TaxID=37653 RepID=A0A0L8HNI3_OCTBM|nr:uncharacterized protein LOC106869569 [Octopus bimaculoides]XP_052830690.1 uncharacterized protein LOC106869569 [Octopus bimaculoides]|eukprot:XP_014770853.1 PREDICTED: uncharacterized protein LOC106869569 [Octopus bimaculoides]